jgi:hypothetical protein
MIVSEKTILIMYQLFSAVRIEMAASASKFVGMLMNSRSQAHSFHLTTQSYAQHKALQNYYEGIVPLLDEWAEAYMGRYGRLRRITMNRRFLSDPKKAKVYFRGLLTRIRALRLPRDSYLRSIQDEITVLIRSTLYMLTLK